MLDSIPTALDDRVVARMRAGDYRAWRARVEAVGGCLQPVRLNGSWSVTDAAGTVLAETGGNLFAPCGNRRASVCPTCSDRYAADAFHLLRAGLSGGAKGIPATVAARPRVFATLTAPSFGPVHGHRTANGRRVPCRCGTYHHPDDPALGTPIDPSTYDYTGAVLWQAHTGALWHRFVIRLRRTLARAAGLTVAQFTETACLSYAKVAEYQRRGLVHFHAVIRVDGSTGPDSPPPRWATPALLEAAIRHAAGAVSIGTQRPDGTSLDLLWGTQVDVRHITARESTAVEDRDGAISETQLANYVAKYSTKGTGATAGTDRPIRSQTHIDQLPGITAHHRQMIQAAWDLGGYAQYAALRLRKWAHMLAFRGHFLTKSGRYSVTFGAIRADRRAWRHTDTLTRLGVDPAEHHTVTVVNHWNFTGIGYRDPAERELATGIAERQAAHRRQRLSTEHTNPRKAV